MDAGGSADATASRIRAIAERMRRARTRGELGDLLAREVAAYSIFDLQVIGGRMQRDFGRLPSPYRERVLPFAQEWLFGRYHRLLVLFRKGAFAAMDDPITDRETFHAYCEMIPGGCFREDAESGYPPEKAPLYNLFYYLLCAFAIFVLEEPGHPVGTPFPGGFRVELRNGEYYCLIREKEQDIWHSICNFCPAKQDDEVP
jgi:uncharacterized protein (UPF0305 family)